MTPKPQPMSWPDWLASVRAKAASVAADYAQAATVLQQAPTGSRLIQQPGLVSEADAAKAAEVP
jgi:hypothetical protein